MPRSIRRAIAALAYEHRDGGCSGEHKKPRKEQQKIIAGAIRRCWRGCRLTRRFHPRDRWVAELFGDIGARLLGGRLPRGRLGGEGIRHALDRCSSVRVKGAQFGVAVEIDEAFLKLSLLLSRDPQIIVR